MNSNRVVISVDLPTIHCLWDKPTFVMSQRKKYKRVIETSSSDDAEDQNDDPQVVSDDNSTEDGSDYRRHRAVTASMKTPKTKILSVLVLSRKISAYQQ